MHSKNFHLQENIKRLVDKLIFKNTGNHLSDIEVEVLMGAWEGDKYEKIAEKHGYSVSYINKDIGNKLWKKLSEVLGEEVTKRNFRQALQREWEKQVRTSQESQPVLKLKFTQGSIAPDSHFFVERPFIEERCYEAIQQISG